SSSQSYDSTMRPLFLLENELGAEALELKRASLALTLLYLASKSLVFLILELVLPRDELVLISQQLVLLEENSSYCSRLQLPVLNQSVNTARITAVGEKVNAAESLLVVSTKHIAN
ncbi:hypothetical protein Tco_0198665, partial [Tanacetum coccineum]